jgi:hypothetical protein
VEIDELADLIEKYLSICKIANAARVSPATIRYWLRVWGLKSKGHNLTSNPRRKPTPPCRNCGNAVRCRPNVYCSSFCQFQFRRRTKVENNHHNVGSRLLKSYLLDCHGRRCEVCGIREWMGKPAPIELDHKDGNPTNNDLTNLRLICPNCHAQTDFYKGRNIGRGRYYRRERYAKGKSY